jgi:hypothetical protein
MFFLKFPVSIRKTYVKQLHLQVAAVWERVLEVGSGVDTVVFGKLSVDTKRLSSFCAADSRPSFSFIFHLLLPSVTSMPRQADRGHVPGRAGGAGPRSGQAVGPRHPGLQLRGHRPAMPRHPRQHVARLAEQAVPPQRPVAEPARHAAARQVSAFQRPDRSLLIPCSQGVKHSLLRDPS